MLQRLYVDNYKCPVNFDLRLQELSLLLGPNGVGKTSVLDVVDAACAEQAIPARRSDEDVFVFVPTWRIETWLAWLDGEIGEAIDEARRDYPRMTRERDSRQHVMALADMCRSGQLRAPAPPSLAAACTEYDRWN